MGNKNLLNLDKNQKIFFYKDIDKKDDKKCFVQYP
jgi:hypothetical protein